MKLIFGILFCLGASQASALSLTDKTQMETSLENSLTQIVKSYDENAFVIVSIKSSIVGVQDLPLLPFVIEDSSALAAQSNTNLGKAQIQIFASEEPPSNLRAMIQNIVKQKNLQIGSINYQNQVRVPKVIEPEKKPELEAPKPLENPSTLDFKKMTDILQKGFDTVSNMSQKLMMIVGALSLTFLLLVFLILSELKRGSKTTGSVLQSGFSTLVSSLEQAQGNSRSEATAAAMATNSSIKDSQYSITHLTAALCDCYWSETDSYASYIWRNMTVQQKETTIQTHTWLKDYAVSLSNVVPEDLGFLEDSYYLSPLPIEKISNTELKNILDQTPSMYHLLPQVRAEKLSLTLKERIELMNSSRAPFDISIIQKAPESPKRMLEFEQTLNVTDEAEELEILNDVDSGLTLVKRVPSLGWLLRLTPTEQADILKPYSAKDLASAWVGPIEVLEQISKNIPEKKYQMMLSYSQKLKASRNNPVFKSIHKATVQILKAQEIQQTETESSAA